MMPIFNALVRKVMTGHRQIVANQPGLLQLDDIGLVVAQHLLHGRRFEGAVQPLEEIGLAFQHGGRERIAEGREHAVCPEAMRQSALGVGGDALPHLGVDLFLGAHEGSAKEFVLVFPMQIDSALGDPSRPGYVVHSRLAVPPAHQEDGGGVQNMLGALRARGGLGWGRLLTHCSALVGFIVCDHCSP